MSDFIDIKNKLVDLAVLIITSMILIFIVYKIAEVLVGQLPATIASTILGLSGIFIYATNRKVRESINDWLKRK